MQMPELHKYDRMPQIVPVEVVLVAAAQPDWMHGPIEGNLPTTAGKPWWRLFGASPRP
jgi:hypothetical protein